MADLTAAGQQQSNDSTAASTVEAPSESAIFAAVADLWNADSGTMKQIEPLARLLPADRFQATFEKLKERRLSSAVRNDAGYFVSLLRVEIQELRAARARALPRATNGTHAESAIERLKRDDPEEYARRMEAHFKSLAQRPSAEAGGE